MHKETPRLLKPLALGASILLFAWPSPAQQFSGHYPGGAEGIKGASLPPPGIYVRDYNFLYWADRNKNGPPNFDAFAYINAPRVIWMTDFKILGADYGMDLLVPFYYADVKAAGLHDHTTAMGDLQFEPLLLSWHLKQFDLSAGYAFWAPSGDANADGKHFSRLLSKGFWSNMFTAGGTWYPTEDKTWAASVLNRYEIHTENKDFKVTPGDSYTVEWGLSKTLHKNIDVGVAGYYQQQVTDDSGAGVATLGYDKSLHDRVVGVGPEISMLCTKLGLFVSVRYAHEFAVKDGPEGDKVTLTLTKRF